MQFNDLLHSKKEEKKYMDYDVKINHGINTKGMFRWHNGAPGTAASSQLQQPRFDPNLQCRVCGVCTFFLTMWVSYRYSSFLPPTFQSSW